MPAVHLLVKAKYLADIQTVLPVLGPALREASAQVLSTQDISREDIEVIVTQFYESDNAPALEIRGLISGTPERVALLPLWSLVLGETWQTIATSRKISWKDDVGAWAFAPPAKWVQASPQALAKRRAELHSTGVLGAL